MKRSVFLIWKRAIFCQIKEIKHLSGGVVLYAAQTNALVDPELVKKGRFRTETNYTPKRFRVTGQKKPRNQEGGRGAIF